MNSRCRVTEPAAEAAFHRVGVARDVNKSLESSSAATACSRVTEGKWSMKRSRLSPQVPHGTERVRGLTGQKGLSS